MSGRADIPSDFGVDSCFDGSKLTLRNSITLVLNASKTGDVGNPTRRESDYGLAADAERLKSSNPDVFLPGDELVYPVGLGAGTVGIRGSSDNGFYAIATTIADFFPGKPNAIVGAFTAFVSEIDDDFTQYHTCLIGKNWFAQIGCRALLTRNVTFAAGRGVVSGGAKAALSTILSVTTWSKWVSATTSGVAASLHESGLIRITPATSPSPTPARPKLSSASSCADWDAASFSERNAYAGTVSPRVQLTAPVPTGSTHAAFMYGFIGGGCDRAKGRGIVPAEVPLSAVLTGDYLTPTTTPTTTTATPTPAPSVPQPQPQSFAVGAPFDSECVVAWPTAPVTTSTTIQMTMSCAGVPENEYLFTQVDYGDPSLPISPDHARAHVVGTIVDIATSAYGYKELVVQASSVRVK
ncbi:MAG: hypothetical protein ACYDHN_11415 [Solirubrobacteraceae bacterium]